jgi:acetyl-CoA carboxylase beta subunit
MLPKTTHHNITALRRREIIPDNNQFIHGANTTAQNNHQQDILRYNTPDTTDQHVSQSQNTHSTTDHLRESNIVQNCESGGYPITEAIMTINFPD